MGHLWSPAYGIPALHLYRNNTLLNSMGFPVGQEGSTQEVHVSQQALLPLP